MTAPAPDSDPQQIGYSLANLADVLFGCLDARAARSVLEVGSFRGELTRELLGWGAKRGARVLAVDPTPEPELLELDRAEDRLELIRETSHEALAHVELPEAVILDGDHNYYTVAEELRLIAERAGSEELPLLLFHDVGWPHARRDTYLAPERIPAERRQPLAHDAGVVPGEPGTVSYGLWYEHAAAREGGPGNGVLTAIEDFIEGRDDLRLAVVPAFFGFGAVWSRGASWAPAVAEVLDPLDRNALLERLEHNRTVHVAARVGLARRIGELEARNAELEALLRALADSRTIALAQRLARLRGGGISRDRIRAVLGDADPGRAEP